MFRNRITYSLIYLWLRYQALAGKLKTAYQRIQADQNPFEPYIRYPFAYREYVNNIEHESSFEVPLSSFQVLTERVNPYKVEFLDNIMNNIEGMPSTVEAWPNGMFKAKRKLVTRTNDNFYW